MKVGKSMRRKSVSLFLAITMFLINVGIPVFSDNITSGFDEKNSSVVMDDGETETSYDIKPLPTIEVKSDKQENKSYSLMSDPASDLTSQLIAGTVTIEEDGEYVVSNIETSNNIVIKQGVTAELTVENVVISSTNVAPIKIESGASLDLHVRGINTFIASEGYAAVAVYANDKTSDYGILIIDGEGTLTATGGKYASGIGTDQNKLSGKIIINGAKITATGGGAAAGIGGADGTSDCGDIEINNGVIIANGGTGSPGIGGNQNGGNGNITINGGYVKASGGRKNMSQYLEFGIGGAKSVDGNIIFNGGSINSIVINTATPKDKFGNTLKQFKFKMPDSSTMAQKEVTVGNWTAKTDEDAIIYPYLPENTDSFAVKYDGNVYFAKNITTDDIIEFEEYDGEGCKCSPQTASISIDTKDSVTVNKRAGQANVTLVTDFVCADDCTYPIHNSTASYTLSIDGVEGDLSSYAKISNTSLIVYYKSAGKTLHLESTVINDGETYTANKDITIIGDDTSRFDLSKSNIIISKSTTDGMIDVTAENGTYTISDDTKIYINQSEEVTSNTITVQGTDTTILFDNINIDSLGSALTLDTDVNLTFEFEGDNSISTVNGTTISGKSTSSIVFNGKGSLNVTSLNGPAIGIKTVVINDGIITAQGGRGAAGIGGTKEGSGSNVTINGGCVYAYGDGNAAGIGGGESPTAGIGGTFIMNGGMVYAKSSANGSGIGGGGVPSSPGIITINGGSVNAYLYKNPKINNETQYLAKFSLEGISGKQDVLYTVGDNSDKIKTSTDKNGYIYLYLTKGYHWIRVYKDNKTYYKYIKIEDNNSNNAICVLNPEASLTKFYISGQIGESVINNEAQTVEVTVPYNIFLSEITPETEYIGSFANPTADEVMDFENDKKAAIYTITGENMVQKEYVVKLILANEPTQDQPDEYDISKGSIVISNDYVEYGGTKYKINDNGYIIKGTSSENTVMVDAYLDNPSTETLPVITFKDLTMTSDSDETLVSINTDVKIKIEGNCSIRSEATEAISVLNEYMYSDGVHVNITGDGNLTIQSEGTAPTIRLGTKTSMSITGPTTTLTAADGNNALAGDGKFITDSATYMNIAESSTVQIRPVLTDDTPLYQVKAQIQADDKSLSYCTYNDKNMYVGDDATFYLMMPDGEQKINVKYNNKEYEGTATVNGGAATVLLYTATVMDITYDYSPLPYTGGKVVFIVEGILVSGNVKIIAKPDNTSLPSLEDTVHLSDGKNIAELNFPLNTRYDKDVTYKIYYILDNVETALDKKIIVNKDDTVCRIQTFSIEGQVSETRITEYENYDSLITLYMPYDHQFKSYYQPTELAYIGGSIDPAEDDQALYTYINNVSVPYNRTYYTVKAKDGTTNKKYVVRMYRENTPQITSLSYTGKITSNGGKIKVTATGNNLSSIANAEHEKNTEVYIYLDNGMEPVKAKLTLDNGIAYVAEIDVPANESDTESVTYNLKAKIGDTEQVKTNSKVEVPRQERGLVGIKEFTINNQLGDTKIVGRNISITMPYDADITSIQPYVTLEDLYAQYTPMNEQDFTSDVTYTVTAENGIDKTDYNVHVQKQDKPVATGIEFTNPEYSAAGRIYVNVKGNYLDNAKDAITLPKTILVSGELTDGDTTNSKITAALAVKDDNGDYIAAIVVPQNNSDTIRKYKLSVAIGGEEQTLSGDVVLTVPARESNIKKLQDIIIAEGQSMLTIVGREEDDGNGLYQIYLYVPYNTDLSAVKPEIFYSGISIECLTSSDEKQNFNTIVTYRVNAQDGTYSDYEIHTDRMGTPNISSLTMNKPATFNDTEITLDITGQFVPYLTEGVEKDVMKISAVPRDGGATVEGTVYYDNSVFYGGHATGHITLPHNDSYTTDKIYDVKITINDVEQNIGLSGIITVPHRRSRKITDFRVNGQVGSTQITEDDVNGNTILFAMPYNTDLTALLPRLVIDGDSYTPTGAQNFESGKSDESKPVTYTVSAESDTDRTYTARVLRDGLPSISSVQVSNTPTTFKGTTVDVDVTGVFFYDMKVKAVSADGNEEIEGTVTMDEWHHATATIDIPTNYDITADKEYKLVFHLDNFEDEITYSYPVKITVPRRKTRAITNFTITNQVGVATITETDIYVQVEYNTNLRELSSTVTIDGDSYTPTGIQNFDNETKSLVYTVSAADDEDRNYTVHISRDGKPTISKLTFLSPINFRGGSVVVNFEGIFFETAEVSVVPVGGGAEIAGTITSFNEGKATGVVNIPTNYDTENEKVYQLKFILDGMITSYVGGTEITVPRRTTREITEFSLPEVQEGDTKIEGTSIYIDVPYHLDIKSVTPEFAYDADKITPEGAQNFSDLDNPVKYTLSSSGDDDVVYTVYIKRIGNDPYLKSMTVENQAKETEYLDDNINIVLKSNAKIKEVEPILDFDGMDYTPRGPQDFSNSKKEPLVYTVFNKYGIEHKYYVTITKKSSGGGGSSSVKSTPKPTSTPTLEPTIEPTLEPTDKPSATPTPTPAAQPKTKPYIKGYEEDGVMYFRPDNTITRAEVATILSLLDEDFNEDTLYQDVFSDIPENAWYRNYMNFAIGKGYISGYDDGTSRPDNMITRAEFASMLARCMDIFPVDGEDRFGDIANFDWCRQQINALADMGIVSGYDGGMFLPDNLISRAETVAMINRMLDREMTEEILERINCPFDDITSSHWAYNDILLASCEY